jgi:hypothetical protein
MPYLQLIEPFQVNVWFMEHSDIRELEDLQIPPVFPKPNKI